MKSPGKTARAFLCPDVSQLDYTSSSRLGSRCIVSRGKVDHLPETNILKTMRLRILSMVLFLLALFLNSASGTFAASKPDSVSPTWSTDLRATVGSVPLGQVFGRKRERQGLPETSLWFLGDSTIVATFVTREGINPSLSSRKSSDPNLPLRMRAIFLDADLGRVTSVQTWPTASTFAKIVAARDRDFVTQRGNTLALYSLDAKELRTLSLPTLSDEVLRW